MRALLNHELRERPWLSGVTPLGLHSGCPALNGIVTAATAVPDALLALLIVEAKAYS